MYSCNNENETSDSTSIQIGNYIFNFPSKFKLEEQQGIDSYVGNINGSGISIFFDYGWYTGPVNNPSLNQYIVNEDEISGHYRQIVKSINSESNSIRIHLYNISEALENPLETNSLTMYANQLSISQQEMLDEVFNNVIIVE
ncbi:hypothetical protein DFQ05_2674 [Winogradskyella wandonensis]|uniref:Uncharacterized protein n=2 Tax=Winogradskyella wandonensis TaxID=1442586 RepID=A0A4V6NEJ9_9FLAO|nr:hypothetical protein DFQ05_2674 [Winogradskyella wandonensis]